MLSWIQFMKLCNLDDKFIYKFKLRWFNNQYYFDVNNMSMLLIIPVEIIASIWY